MWKIHKISKIDISLAYSTSFVNKKTSSGIQKMCQVEVWFSQTMYVSYHTESILSKEKRTLQMQGSFVIRLLSSYVTLRIQRFLEQPILTPVIVLSLQHQCLVTLVLVVLVLVLPESLVLEFLVFVALELLI